MIVAAIISIMLLVPKGKGVNTRRACRRSQALALVPEQRLNWTVSRGGEPASKSCRAARAVVRAGRAAGLAEKARAAVP